MDCLSIPDSADFNCTNLWGVNCTSKVGFDFNVMWNITQKIQRHCPTDPRLFLNQDTPATAKNAALTGAACKAIAGGSFRYYAAGDIWVRLTTWKFPLLQLVAASPRPPLGLAVEGFVIAHLLGDPIGTIKDLLRVISKCQKRAEFWIEYTWRLRHFQVDDLWKAFTIVTISYDEWGVGDEAQGILKNHLDDLLEDGSASELETFLNHIKLTADALAADRATRFLPIIVAQGFFIGAIAVAIVKIISSLSPLPSNLYINVEAHSIASSALHFWIIPAVFLASIIGVSQTQNAVPRVLRRLQTGMGKEMMLLNQVLWEKRRRVVSGGIYSWLPEESHQDESKHFVLQLCREAPPILIVLEGTITALLMSGHIPPQGWQTRHCVEATTVLVWLISFALTAILKRHFKSSPSYNRSGRFWVTFAKDILATSMTWGITVAGQSGWMNRCDSYTRWGRTPLALPEMPEVAEVLELRIRTVYPAIVFVGILLQILLVPVVIAVWYRQALLVFLQRDVNAEAEPGRRWSLW